ncbi:MAG: ExbD/TolR family protein [Lacipirellulaceae bacterium]
MPLKPTPDDGAQLNLTPMIDVVFLLVIFFMTATKFSSEQRDIELTLPSVDGRGTQLAAMEKPLTVRVDSRGAATLDGRPLGVAALTAELKAAAHENDAVEVLLYADSAANFQSVAEVMAACRSAGIANLGVAVEVASAPAPERK